MQNLKLLATSIVHFHPKYLECCSSCGVPLDSDVGTVVVNS